MNKNFLTIGPFEIKWYAIIIVSALIVGLFLFLNNPKIKKLNKNEKMYDYLFWLAIFGFIGARTWYVLFSLPYYMQNPGQIIAIWNGGLAIHGGIVGGGLYTLYFAYKEKLSVFTITDALVPSLMLGQAIGRWGNFVNQEAHGEATTRSFLESLHLPQFIVNGMDINGTYYQPTFLYESIWNLIGFLIIIFILRRFNQSKLITGFYLLWYGIIRAVIEQYRTDALYFGTIRIAQLTSLIFIVIGLYFVIISLKEYSLRKNK